MLDSVKEVLVKDIEVQDVKDVLLHEIEMKAIKEVLLKEIDISKLRESLISEIKETLLKEIDLSVIKETLTKEIVIKDLVSSKEPSKQKKPIRKDINSSVAKTSNDKKTKTQKNMIQKSNTQKINLPAYKYGLTEGFKNEHQEISSIFENIILNANDKDYVTLPLMLSKFTKKCAEHFNAEEELYLYMKALAGSRSEIERKVANEFSAEMKNLSVSLFSIINQSNYIPVNDNTVDGFVEELGELGEILQERIRREEKILYPLYENSRKVIDIS